ncbi:MAG: response regulator [Candidatus Aureabacteria bacterium]|nr:response regulator [Candidatus Auribacterota bacterium]
MSNKVLIVDDQAFIRHIYSADLRNAGYEVFCAESAAKAMQILADTSVDIILLDAVMPEIDGYTLCSKLRSQADTKDIPVIFLTANADKTSVIKAVQAGANDFFVKCPDTNGLLIKISKYSSRMLT